MKVIMDHQDEAALNLFVALIRTGFDREGAYAQLRGAGVPRASILRAARVTLEGANVPGETSCPVCEGGFDRFACNVCNRGLDVRQD